MKIIVKPTTTISPEMIKQLTQTGEYIQGKTIQAEMKMLHRKTPQHIRRD